MALPGVRIVAGEELYASYGGDYWLDHLPNLPTTIRQACIRRYKHSVTKLRKAGLLRDGSKEADSTQNIRAFLSPRPLRPSEYTTAEDPDFRLCYSVAAAGLPVQPSDPYHVQREALILHLQSEAVLQVHLQEPSDMYNVCAPDGSCGIQLALLHWQLPEHPWGPIFSAAGSATSYL